MIRFISKKKDLADYDVTKFYTVNKRENRLSESIPLAIATSFEEAYDACVILLELKGNNYKILPPTDK